MFKRVEGVIAQLEKGIVIIALMVMLIATFLQVILRFAGLPLMGTVDIGLLSLAIFTFIGIGLAAYTNDHIIIEAIELMPSRKIRMISRFAALLLTFVFGIVLVWIVYPYWTYTIESGEKTIELGIPLAVHIGAFFAGGVLLVLHTIGQLVGLFGEIMGKPTDKGGVNDDEHIVD
jgi:TRAP-type C4-dicarboxylate transport system permease small subunit